MGGAWAFWRPYRPLIAAAPRLTVWSDKHVNSISTGLTAPTAGALKLWQEIEPRSEELLRNALLTAQREIDRYVRECL